MSEALFSGWQPHSQQQPRPELVEALWDLLSPKDRILACAIYQTDAGQELRLSYPGDDLVRSEFVPSRHRARRSLGNGVQVGVHPIGTVDISNCVPHVRSQSQVLSPEIQLLKRHSDGVR